ncbi:MAG: hypothetical protein JWQ11_2152 [Rhizobacter sp.]|nr:hypothetical protein [Rhizobacter sp.]
MRMKYLAEIGSGGQWSLRGAVASLGRLAAMTTATTTAGVTAMAAVMLAGLFATNASAQTTPAAQIYTCVDAQGRTLTSDRSIAECNSRNQLLRNRDGSVKAVVPPVPTADERAEAENRLRRDAAARASLQEATRRDRNLLSRYPDEAAHSKAREVALDDVRQAVKASQDRVAVLAKERKPLENELEFYKKKTPPSKLLEQLDANDAAVDAQKDLVRNLESERERIVANFDLELARLRKLWAGATPGSLGSMESVVSASK